MFYRLLLCSFLCLNSIGHALDSDSEREDGNPLPTIEVAIPTNGHLDHALPDNFLEILPSTQTITSACSPLIKEIMSPEEDSEYDQVYQAVWTITTCSIS